ncbi:MAG TPA: response regulator transcription factor [Planctomycetota bacterium]|jgi:DNA-binding NarL/FixJ family response regulator
MAKTARILLADDSPMVRLGLSVLFSRQPSLKVLGEAGDAGGLLRSVSALEPDLVVGDVFLPGSPGLDLIGAIRNKHAGTRLLVYSDYDEILFAERAVRAGAAGYVMKREPAATVLQAVRHILKGGIFVTPRAAGSLLHQMSGHRALGMFQAHPLSDRELDVMRRMGEGFTSREMAQAMHLSIKTVEAHREHIKAKLGLGSGPELMRLAIQWSQSDRRPGSSRSRT